VNPHLQRLTDALRQEEAWQKRELEAALARPRNERLALGVAWPLVKAEPGPELILRARAPLHDGIRAGDPIDIQGVSAWVEEVEGPVAVVNTQADLPPGELEVTKRFDPTPFTRGHQALRRVDECDGPLREAWLDDEANEAIELLHGPPGTGKTWTSSHRIADAVREGDRPWALADSNAAADNLALACVDRGLTVLRVGRAARMHPLVRPFSLEDQINSEPSVAVVLKALRKARGPDRGRLHGELRGLRRVVRRNLVGGSDVLVSTLATLVRHAPQLPPPELALVDEATQALEPLLMAPLPFAQRLLLVGDPHQLGPVVKQPGNPLQHDAFTRLVQRQGAPMLEVQYRMDRRIQALVQPVYGPDYRPHPSVADHGQAPLFIDTAGAGFDEQRDPVTMSLHNPGERRLVSLVVDALRAKGLEDIGIIAPYSAQVHRLRERFPDLEVATVNAFQGRERQAIVCTWVRSNDVGELGFVADRRRLTVAVTRAREALVLIGDSATLAGHPVFAQLLDDCEAASAWEEPWSGAMEDA